MARSIEVTFKFNERDIKRILDALNDDEDRSEITLDDIFENEKVKKYFIKEIMNCKEEILENSWEAINNDWLCDIYEKAGKPMYKDDDIMINASDTLKNDIRLYAMKHYEDGYDMIVKYWDDKDFNIFIAEEKITSVEDFVVAYAPILSRLNKKATAE